MALPSPALFIPRGKVATLSLLHLLFACRVAVDVNLPPMWEAVDRGRGKMEGLTTLNQALMRGLPSCHQIFRGRANFIASLPLFAFLKNASLMNPSLDLACTGGGFMPWLTRQGLVEAYTCGGADASLLVQQLDVRLELADCLGMAARVCLAVISSADESLCDLGTFAFVVSHLFFAGGATCQPSPSSSASFRGWRRSTLRCRG